MAGRGTDILLGGNPEVLAGELLHKQGTNVLEATPEQYAAALREAEAICAEDKEQVLAAGGLHIVGTERHEARRIDNQLRGRAGRQGDPGSSRFYLSLEDDLMRRFANDRVQGLMQTLGFTDDTALESKMVSRRSRTRSHASRATTSTPASTSSSTTTSSTASARRSTASATGSCASTDLGPTVEAMLEDEIAALVAEHTAGDHHSDWNLDGLRTQLTAMVPTLTDADLAFARRGPRGRRRSPRSSGSSSASATRSAAPSSARRAAVSSSGSSCCASSTRCGSSTSPRSTTCGAASACGPTRSATRSTSSRSRRTGCSTSSSRRSATTSPTPIFRVTVQQTPHTHAPGGAQRRARVVRRRRPGTASAAGAVHRNRHGNGNGAQPATRSGPKVGRNDPCWCGSGKKYKKCHGS